MSQSNRSVVIGAYMTMVRAEAQVIAALLEAGSTIPPGMFDDWEHTKARLVVLCDDHMAATQISADDGPKIRVRARKAANTNVGQ